MLAHPSWHPCHSCKKIEVKWLAVAHININIRQLTMGLVCPSVGGAYGAPRVRDCSP